MVNLKYTITASGTKYVPVSAGEFIVQVAGTWDGATVAIHWDYDGGSVAYSGGSFTANGSGRFDIASGKFAIVTTNAGANTSLKIFIAPVVGRTREL